MKIAFQGVVRQAEITVLIHGFGLAHYRRTLGETGQASPDLRYALRRTIIL